MANSPSIVNFASSFATFSAIQVSNGTYADIVGENKVDNAQWRADARWANMVDDFITEAWPWLETLAGGGGGGGAPTGAEYLVGALSGGLSAERVPTATATISWSFATPAQALASVIPGGIDVTTLAGYPGGGTAFLRDDGTFASPTGGLTQPQVMARAFGGS